MGFKVIRQGILWQIWMVLHTQIVGLHTQMEFGLEFVLKRF